jgi:hypothetical protein
MLKNCTRLECVVNEKVGHFYCDIDTPLPVVKEMIFQFQKYIGLVEDQIRAQEDKKAEDDAPEELEEQIIGE